MSGALLVILASMAGVFAAGIVYGRTLTVFDHIEQRLLARLERRWDRADDDDFAPEPQDELTERGRQLASERDELIAAGADPADLLIPLAPPEPQDQP